MNPARIVVLIIALSTGGIAACLANRPADIKPNRTESIVRLLAAAGTGDARFAIEPSRAAQR
jgi:Flp pilus assembly protein CpaB